MKIPAAVALVVLLAAGLAHAQVSEAVAHDDNVNTGANKFLQREAYVDDNDPVRSDEAPDRTCGQNLAVRWHTELASSVYATPLITDLYSDGRKDVIVPGFRRRLHVLEGRAGAEDTTFEAQHRSTLHVSPLLYDIDFDGVPDILVATYDGNVQFFKDTGSEVGYRLFIPRLKVKQDWFKGLNPDPTDHAHPDVGAGGDDSGLGERGTLRRGGGGRDAGGTAARRRLLEVDPGGGGGSDAGMTTVEAAGEVTEEAAESFGELFGQNEEEEAHLGGHDPEEVEARAAAHKDAAGGGAAGDGQYDDGSQHYHEEDWINDDQVYDADDDLEGEEADWDEFSVDEEEAAASGAVGATDGDAPATRRHIPSRPLPAHVKHAHHAAGDQPRDDIAAGADDDYFGMAQAGEDARAAGMWEDDFAYDHEADTRAADRFRAAAVPEAVWLDAHVLATPAIADIDGDGREELVIPVSYFFDPGDYAADSVRTKVALGPGGDIGKYLASGIVVFDLHTRAVKWTQHLDLSTRYTRYKAEIHAPPTLADVDKDGRLEIIVGTSMGFIYVLDPVKGAALEGWPVQMGDVQGQVAVGDVDGDGWLEIIAADTRGSVTALRVSGKEVWERHLGSAIGAGVTLGDVDGDGQLEVVVGTFDGRIHVLNAATGADKPGFPFRTYGRIATPVLLTKLSPEPLPKALAAVDKRRGAAAQAAERAMQLVVTSHDGFLYAIDAATGCADSIDLGEPSYSMVLADDLAGTGHLDLLVTTAGGNVYALRTAARFQPLKAWPAQTPGTGTAGSTARWNWEGVYATATTRVPRDVRGEAVPVRFTVVDRRPLAPGGKRRGPYRISVTLAGVGSKEMGVGDQPVIGMSDTVNATGTYTLEVPCPRTRTSATIRVEMRDETGAVFADEFSLSFHIHFYRLLKWLAVGPFLFTAAAVALATGGASLRLQLPE